MKSVIRPPDRHPYEIYLLVVFTFYGAADLLDILPTPASIRAQLPFTWVWSLLLTVGSAAALAAILWKRVPGKPNFTALLYEKVGLVIVGSVLIIAGAAIIVTNGAAGAFQGANNIGFGLASFTQAALIHAYIKRVHTVLQQAVEEEIIEEARRRGERL